ncbi:alpha/beta hydrolase [Mycetocola zhujimingii]|nr:alpha/beta hydrolase [Mycetocola zhujimingii]
MTALADAIADNSVDAQPFGYLITAIAMAWMVFFAAVPLRQPRILGEVSFRSGLVVSEQPFYPFYLLVGLTVLAGVEGELSTVVGQLSLAIVAAVSFGLAVIAVNSTAAPGVVDRALDAGLGEGWRAGGGNTGRRRLPLGRILFLPFATRRRDVRLIRNISYGDAGRQNLLDVYASTSGRTGSGVFIFLHGGGFRSGHKSFESRVLLNNLASEGWLCISANYRVGRSASFPDYLVDTKKVIVWARANAPAYGGDASMVAVGGSSAGAHLASMCALTPGHAEFQPGFEEADTTVSAAVCLYGWYGRASGGTGLSSPHDFLPPVAGTIVPPFFIAHGDHDTLVPVEAARDFVSRLREETDAPVVYAELPHAQHAFDLFHSIRSDAVARGIQSFLSNVRTRARR